MNISKFPKWINAVLAAALVVGYSAQASAQFFDEKDHKLITLGHTNSAEWDSSIGKYVATCDFKKLNGSVPRMGEACDGSPRLSFTVEDLQSLRYITQASDHMEFVRRVYERFPKEILFVSANKPFNYGSSAERQTSQTVNFGEILPSGVTSRDYSVFTNIAESFLSEASSSVYGQGQIIAAVMAPYSNDVKLGGTLENTQRLLPERTIVFFHSNPDRGTMVHELLHFLIDRAESRAIGKPGRLKELGLNDGKSSWLSSLFFDEGFSEEHYDPLQIAYWDLVYLEYMLENRARSTPEELEIAYFISKFGEELGLPSSTILAHREDFWKYTAEYQRILDVVYGNVVQGRAPKSTVEPINNRDSFIVDGEVVKEFFRDYWKKISTIAKAYPTNLLGDENNVNRQNPRTIIDHFVVDVGPRSATTASR